jgi:uroporphyrinogen-III synthase
MVNQLLFRNTESPIHSSIQLSNNAAQVVFPVPVYRWALPENPQPLIYALREIAAQRVHAVLFTSAGQIPNVLQIARQAGLENALRNAAETTLKVISIGPACSEALKDAGLPVHGEASPPKMGQMVRLAVELCRGPVAANELVSE